MDRLRQLGIFILVGFVVLVCGYVYFKYFFTEESQNQMARKLSATLGMKGVVEVYDGGKVMRRFIDVEKLSTAYGTNDKSVRPYRYGYGYNDKNLDGTINEDEKSAGKVYFEFSEYSQYIYLEDK